MARFLRRLLRRLPNRYQPSRYKIKIPPVAPVQDIGSQPPTTTLTSDEPGPDPDEIARPAIERLAEDARLRGGLTDAGFGPIVQTVSSLVLRAAKESATAMTTVDPDKLASEARALARAIVRAAESGDPQSLVDVASPSLIVAEEHQPILAELPSALQAATSDERAEQLARLIQSKSTISGPSEQPS